jgi:hypothetical protein
MNRALSFLIIALSASPALAADWLCVATGSFDTCKSSPVRFCVPSVEVESVSASSQSEARNAALSGCQSDLDRKIGQVSFTSTIENVVDCRVTGCSEANSTGGTDGGGAGGNGGEDNGQCRSVQFEQEKRMISDAFSSFKKAIKQARSVVKKGASAEVSSFVVATTKTEVKNASKQLARIGDAIFVGCSVQDSCKLSGSSGIAASVRKSGKRSTRSAVNGLKSMVNTEEQRANLKAAFDNLKSSLDEVPGNSAVCR